MTELSKSGQPGPRPMILWDETRLQLARTDRSYPRGRIYAQLEEACDDHLRTQPEQLLQRGPTSNLFLWDAVIGELGLMHALTGDERYFDHVRSFVRSLGGDGWRSANLDGDIHVPWVFNTLAGFHDLHRHRLGDDEAGDVYLTMVAMAEFIWEEWRTRKWSKPQKAVWNHTIIGYSALGIAGLVLEDHPLAEKWLDTSIYHSRRFLEEGVSAAGMTWEGLTYCGFVFKHLGLLIQALDILGHKDRLVPEGSEHEQRLQRVPAWYAHEMFPKGCWLQNYNDSRPDPHKALWGFLQSFAGYQPDLCAAVWEHLVGRRGLATFGRHGKWSSLAEAMVYFPDVTPDPGALEGLDDMFLCPDVGYLSARDQWSENSSIFTFNSGPAPDRRRHDHADNNSFTFIAQGEPLIIDSGPAKKRRREGSESSAVGHNLVFIDGLGEYVPRGKKGEAVPGRILGAERTDTHVAVSGDATASYTYRDHNPIRHALRHAVFVKHPIPYLLTYDDIQKDDAQHLYEYLLHVPSADPADQKEEVVVETMTILTNEGDVAGRVMPLHPPRMPLTAQPFSSRSEPFEEHALWRLASESVNPHFLVLFMPGGSSIVQAPEAEVQRSVAAWTVRLRWAFGADEIVFYPAGETTPTTPKLPEFSRSAVPEKASRRSRWLSLFSHTRNRIHTSS